MDKWRSGNKGGNRVQVTICQDSLLPPTRRPTVHPPLLDKRSSNRSIGKKWSIDGFLRRVSSILDAQTDDSTSSEVDESSESLRRKVKGKAKGATATTTTTTTTTTATTTTRPIGYAYHTPSDYSAHLVLCSSDLVNANGMSCAQDTLTQSRSSDGSLDGPGGGGGGGGGRRVRKDRVKARVEAKRDQLCVGDSSMDESSHEEHGRANNNGQRDMTNGKRRSRASRTERYLKRMCNGANGNAVRMTNGATAVFVLQNLADSRNLEGRGIRVEQFRPIERVPRCDYAQNSTGISNGDTHSAAYYESELPEGNPQSRQHGDIGINPLVQQTLQYFSEFDRNMSAACQHKSRKTYPQQHHRRRDEMHGRNVTTQPPKPPSRDHRSRILVNGAAMDKYQHMLRYVPRPAEQHYLENGFHASSRSALHSPNTEVRNINEGKGNYGVSSTHNRSLPRTSPRSPFGESHNTTVTSALLDGTQSPLLDMNKSKYLDRQSSPCFSPILQKNDYENSNYVQQPARRSDSERRSSKNLEEALCELEAIYNSLQLGDEELLERAEKRTMEEFHYKGFTVSPDVYENENTAARRKTWADSSLGIYKEEPEIPDRLKDDMAYRRMHPKERPSSVDGQSSLSSFSYLMTSPIPSRRDMCYIDPKRKPRRKEPDVMLDDVVFRNLQYANNTLKVVDPQPPFGIPLGPIATAADSDYLHTKPTKLERARSPYIPNPEPDLVTDDLAFRNLRKDAQPSSSSSRQASPNLLSPPTVGSPLSFGSKKKRAVRSLSANLYGLINKESASSAYGNNDQSRLLDTDSVFDDFFDEVPVKCISRRTSDPELMTIGWQKNTWDDNRNANRERLALRPTTPPRGDDTSDVDLSSRSWEESSVDEKILPQQRLEFGDRDTDCKTGSEKGSSYLSSTCSTPPPVPSRTCVEPVTEQEISVYRQLCQDLENLVQLTKGRIDAVPAARELSVSGSQKENVHEDKAKANETWDTSPIKRELSTILDKLRSLGEESNRSFSSSCSEKDEEEKIKVKAEDEKEEEPKKLTVASDDKGFEKITKDICDLAEAMPAKEPEKEKEIEEEEEEEEEDESKDRLLDDNVFFRNVQLAKLSGDWKESTPNNSSNPMTMSHRRTSLADDNSHWEGMTKCNHKYNSMPAKTSSLLPFRHYGSKRKSNRKSMCSVS